MTDQTIRKRTSRVSLPRLIGRLPFIYWHSSLGMGSLLVVAMAVTTAVAQAKPEIQNVSVRSVSLSGAVVTFEVEISGSGFGNAAGDPSVVEFLDATGANVATILTKTLESDMKIKVRATAPLGSNIDGLKLTTNGQTMTDSNFKLSLKAPAPAPAITPFQIKTSTITAQDSPIQTLFVTSESGSFSSNPHRMTVEILPAGATNISIREGSNPFNLMVDFIAPQKFEIKGVVVTVYDSSDLDTRHVVAISQPFQEKKPTADPNQPTISRVKVANSQRRFGYGRLIIEGSGFGNYPRPPAVVEDKLISYRECVATPTAGCVVPALGVWDTWSDEIAKSVKIELVPRVDSLRVEQTKILYIDDKLIDIYFEFKQYAGYAVAFRLNTVTATIKKPGSKQLQVLKAPGVVATIEGPETYLARSAVGLPMSENLKTKYTVLSNEKANNEFGKGIAENFYVVELSVTNLGDKKIAIPLAAIDADVDWASGQNTGANQPVYVDGGGPETPLPMEDVSAFFDAYQKQAGKRAKVFNIFEGMTTLMASLVPIFGPGFKDAHVIFTGGFIPGAKKAIGDLSGQQLQNLTSRSWQNVEIISDHGGSLTKVIFIQRGEQSFNEGNRLVGTNIRKLILLIRGIEVTGFEVSESKAASSVAMTP